MTKTTIHKQKSILNTKSRRRKVSAYVIPENPIEFYISEETAEYGKKKPFTIFFDNPAYSVRLLKGDCIEILNQARENSADMIFADPPYFLSNGGITCHAGKMVSVNKGKWDKSKGITGNHKFNLEWLKACQRVLKPNGTIWVSGTTHIIYSVGFAMQELGYKILNDIVWYKHYILTNLSHKKYFTNIMGRFIWASKTKKSKHYFNYQLMKKMNNGKQMRNVWQLKEDENLIQKKVDNILKTLPSLLKGKELAANYFHRPIELFQRIVLASTREGDLILDPLCTNLTIAGIAALQQRKYVGILPKRRNFKK